MTADNPGMRLIAGGTFTMGSEAHYPEERPLRRVRVNSFWIDETPVTNRQFARPAARHPEMIDSATSHIGFRCVIRG